MQLAEGFPGLYCPGLIEASLNLTGVDVDAGKVSGALLPRPH